MTTNPKMDRPPPRLLVLFLNFLAKYNLLFFPIKGSDGIELLSNINKHKTTGRINQSHHQAFNLVKAVQATNHLDADMAEIGVFKGGSAKLMLEHCRSRHIHLFDTFNGLPEVDESDDKKFAKGLFFGGHIEEVQEYLGPEANVSYHQGLFPNTSFGMEDMKFSFVHIDVDLVVGTEECLKFFYPRMVKGGIIISQDYGILPVRGVIDGFFKDKPESVLEILYTQCVIVKL